MTEQLALDDRSAPIHWAQSKNAARGNLYYIFRNSDRIAECWNQRTADLLVTALRGLEQLNSPERAR